MTTSVTLNANDRIVFIGDSITDAERHRRAYGPLGFGYVHFVAHWLLAKYPDLNLDIANTGVSGDTVAQMATRWERDCLAYRPSVVSVLIGINDVWRSVMEPDSTSLSPERYEITYDQLLLDVRQRCHCQIVLAEPFLFNSDPRDPVFETLQPYLNVVRALSEKHGAVLVPLQQKLNECMAQVPPARWSQDTVHPYLWAHAWIAQRWLEAVGC
jgi:lysophospholipase L1-like esterase